MTGISTGTGLISGINFTSLVDSLMTVARRPVARLESRVKTFQAKQTGISTLEANILSISTALSKLKATNTFKAYSVKSTDETQFTATTTSTVTPGTYQFQTVQTASTNELLSRGFANADKQKVGAGTITIATGGKLSNPTTLDTLNGGNGVRRGTIRITDRSGASADIDLSAAFTMEDVLGKINSATGVAVTASTVGGQLILSDTSGSTTSNLTIAEVNGGHTAEDLGIKQSVSSNTLTGSEVYSVTEDFTLNLLNDGNGLRLIKGAEAFRITTQDGSQINVKLDDAANLGDVIDAINDHESNAGKVTASLTNGRLQLTDNTTGAGTLTIEDINDSSVVSQLGLGNAASGGTITGDKLMGGINSVLLRNLRGGQGIDQKGQITLTNRAGVSATVDLTSAESLDEVLHAINTASDGGASLQLSARLNDQGTGIIVEDQSGGTTGNFSIADVGGSTLATQLGIATDSTSTSVNSGSLNLRYINEASKINKYAPDGKEIDFGSIRITDSAGNEATFSISSATKTIGDVLQRINASTNIQVRAELNETGDGFVLIDEAGGPGEMKVGEVDGTTAADLRILGTAENGKIESRLTTVVEVDADDTLNDVVSKLNAAGAFAKATVVNDGTAFNSSRLQLRASESGSKGNLIIDDGGLGLNLSTITTGQNAMIRVGGESSTGFLISSSSNQFTNAMTGIDLTAKKAGTAPADVTVTQDTAATKTALKDFITAYNSLLTKAKDLTKFDAATSTRGVLQGNSVVSRVLSRLSSLVTDPSPGSSTDDAVRSLFDAGVNIGEGGKLSISDERLDRMLAENPEELSNFFLDKTNGFAVRATEALESITDPLKGTISLEEKSLQNSIDSLQTRIDQLDDILAVRRERLLRQFVNMESALASLTSQQQSMGAISPIKIK